MSVHGITEFDAALDRFQVEVERERLPELQRRVSLEVLTGIVKGWPGDTGRSRANFQTTVGTPASGEVDTGTDPIGTGLTVLAELPPFDVVWITNNVPYATVIEEGGFVPPDPGPSKDPRPGRKGRILVKGGYSVQAPRGVVGVVVEQVRSAFGGV